MQWVFSMYMSAIIEGISYVLVKSNCNHSCQGNSLGIWLWEIQSQLASRTHSQMPCNTMAVEFYLLYISRLQVFFKAQFPGIK